MEEELGLEIDKYEREAVQSEGSDEKRKEEEDLLT